MELLSALLLDSCLRPHSATGLDGIWTFLSNKEVSQIAKHTHRKRKATDNSGQLYRETMRHWKLRVLFASGWKGSAIL